MDTFEQDLVLQTGVAPPPSTREEPVRESDAPSCWSLEPASRSDMPSCLRQAVRQHSRFVIGLLGKLGVDAAEVDDVAQEVYLAIHSELASYDAHTSFKTWLCGVCRHKAADYRRKRARRRSLASSRPPDLLPEADCPQNALLYQEAKELLRRAIGRLSDEQLEIYVLHAVEDMPMRVVAELVGCPVDTAYTRFRTARQSVEAFCKRVERSERP